MRETQVPACTWRAARQVSMLRSPVTSPHGAISAQTTKSSELVIPLRTCVEKDRIPIPTQFVEWQAELLVPCLLGEAVLLGTSWLMKHRQDTHVLLVLKDKQ